MPELYDDLISIADKLESIYDNAVSKRALEPLKKIEECSDLAGKAWSGSWLGYHANVYYSELQVPPAGAHFSQEWGLKDAWPIDDTRGSWVEYKSDDVIQAILEMAGNPDITSVEALSGKAAVEFQKLKPEVLSILSTSLESKTDVFMENLKDRVTKTDVFSKVRIINAMQPKGRLMSRDSLAVSQGFMTPPHYAVKAHALAIRHPFDCCKELSQLARNAGSHLSRKASRRKKIIVGTNVFIGHGKSLQWRELKDFVSDRLKLPWDEFNRVPVAGVTNIARLSELLDAAAIAILVMTGEDEQADGKLHARMNVIHEAGLFQGRLGFSKAIVVLEDGCEEFTNIQGLGQIRFPKGKIRASFDEIRQVLEREGLVDQA
jgi:predicted nucleotide-binding protein